MLTKRHVFCNFKSFNVPFLLKAERKRLCSFHGQVNNFPLSVNLFTDEVISKVIQKMAFDAIRKEL